MSSKGRCRRAIIIPELQPANEFNLVFELLNACVDFILASNDIKIKRNHGILPVESEQCPAYFGRFEQIEDCLTLQKAGKTLLEIGQEGRKTFILSIGCWSLRKKVLLRVN